MIKLLNVRKALDVEVTSLPERFLTGVRRRTFGIIFRNDLLRRPFWDPGHEAVESPEL